MRGRRARVLRLGPLLYDIATGGAYSPKTVILRHAASSERLDALLRRDPSRVLKILASSAYDIQRREIQLLETLLTDEHAARHLPLVVPAHTPAYGILKLMETYLYADVVAGEPRDIDSAVRIVALLLPAGPATGNPHP